MNYKETLIELMADTYKFAKETGHPVPQLELFAKENEKGIMLLILADKLALVGKQCNTEQEQQVMCHDMLTLAIGCMCKELTEMTMRKDFNREFEAMLQKHKRD